MDSKPPTVGEKRDGAKRLLARVPVIAGACELDVLVFLHRHPRTLLTMEHLAGFVGYDMKLVARVIDSFIAAGLLERTQNPMHAARMYRLVLNGPAGGGLRELLQTASTRLGRREILQLLVPQPPQGQSQEGQSQNHGPAAPLDIARARARRRFYATA